MRKSLDDFIKNNDISKSISDPVSKNKSVVRDLSEELYKKKNLENSTREIDLSISLDFDEESRIRDIIKKDNSFEEVDLKEILDLSKRIKSIKAQEALIVGEAVKKAQTVLSNYSSGVFSEWLVELFGNVQTPYNFLRFFELYTLLKERSQKEYLSIPRRAAYKLAKVEGSTEQKEEFISLGKNKNASSLEEEIDILFPKSQRATKTRKVSPENIPESLEKILSKTLGRVEHIDTDKQKKLAKLLVKILSKMDEDIVSEELKKLGNI
jgi:hypothetical protein